METTREQKAKYTLVSSVVCQAITLLCGLLIPRLMLTHYGSEAYGATASITQFLGYIALLDGGVSGVTRAALYKPLAQNNISVISEVMYEIKRFFRIIGIIFIAYVLFIACTFKNLSSTDFDWLFCFWLVIAISISTFAQYFIGISYMVFLQAAQRSYITNLASIVTIVLNTLMVLILVNTECNLIVVKFVSSCVFVIKPVFLWFYVKSKFPQIKPIRAETNRLKQKWDGLGQHLAYYLHSNSAVAILTVCGNLTLVAVYAVYNMVVAQMQSLVASISAGMEALFGDMIAKNEKEQLENTFSYYDTLISVVTTVLFSTTAVMLVPFVQVYTTGLTDADYYAPAFSVLLVLSSFLYCLRIPYHGVVTAAGRFKETQWAAYGEAVINIAISFILVHLWGLIGVAIGTLAATIFRFSYYVFYLSRHIMKRNIHATLKREIINAMNFVVVFFIGQRIITLGACENYLLWVLLACGVFIMAVTIVVATNILAYKKDCKSIYINFFRKAR